MIIPPTWTLPESIKARLGQTTFGRQRTIVEDGHILLVLHKPPGPDDQSREGLLFWRDPRGEWQFSRGGTGPGALKRHVQSYAELENKLTQDYEKAADIQSMFNIVEALTPLARSARNMHQALQAAREAVQADTHLIELRDMAYEVDRNLNLLLEDARNLIQYRIARDAEEQSRLGREALGASHRLNLLAALFFPLTAISSVFGMNIVSGLDATKPALFWGIFMVGASLGFAIKAWVVRTPRASRKQSE